MNNASSAATHRVRITGVVVFGAFLALLNQTVMSPALPVIMADFAIDASTAQWIMSIYPLVSGIMVPVSAFLIDRFTTRQLFFAATGAFAAGTALCAAAPTFFLLICGRVLQAAASGVLLPLVSVVPMLVFPVEKRGTAMGMAGIVMSAGPAKILGVQKGRLLPGYDADFALVDENREWVVDAAQFASKGKNSPFDGVRLQGKVVRTIKAGKTTWQE